MKKILYLILVIDIIGIAIGFFAALSVSIFYAVLVLISGVISLVPLIAIISNMDNIEKLFDEFYRMKYEIKKLNDNNKPDNNKPESGGETVTITSVTHREKARGAWECVKCGTVNKEGTDTCQNCKASYSPIINPTSNPYEKKKVSRWIKDKKK